MYKPETLATLGKQDRTTSKTKIIQDIQKNRNGKILLRDIPLNVIPG